MRSVFSERLRTLRHKKRMKQQEMADFLGLKYAAYITCENKTRVPSCETIIEIADKLTERFKTTAFGIPSKRNSLFARL